MTTSTTVERAINAARVIRNELLHRSDMPRNLAGQCGLASMHVAKSLRDLSVLRVGFYMKRGRFYGRPGRYPHLHAWCQIHDTIVDSTATQFGHRHAVYVKSAASQDRYIETASARDALHEIMVHWRGHALPEYARLARQLWYC